MRNAFITSCLCRVLPWNVRFLYRSLDCGWTLDLVVGQLVIVELKAVEKVERIHEEQVLTYGNYQTSGWVYLLTSTFRYSRIASIALLTVDKLSVPFVPLW
jgi:GxxExxY protein